MAPDEGQELRLPTADGNLVVAESVRCIYRQSVGSDDTLRLQLQFLGDPEHVAFGIYVDDPKPATPYRGGAGDDSDFRFEAFANGVAYSSALRSTELVVHLDDLPSPGQLGEGQQLSLRGTLELTNFTVPEFSALGETGPGSLKIAPGTLPILCTARFETSQIVD